MACWPTRLVRRADGSNPPAARAADKKSRFDAAPHVAAVRAAAVSGLSAARLNAASRARLAARLRGAATVRLSAVLCRLA